jgi:hypothetical protein
MCFGDLLAVVHRHARQVGHRAVRQHDRLGAAHVDADLDASVHRQDRDLMFDLD